ncbi:DUF3341 domain-containing protein [Flavobacteriaceae bacterium Ap0902]|nr:DUF3341 domain-containing protein [Flavobacteriaceae bacterium Ap0902]
MNMNTKIYGLYGDDDELLNAVHSLSKKGVKINEVYTPFPVHGLDKALGLKKTRISDLAFIYGAYGLILMAITTWYMMNYDWPQDIGGKPSFSWAENVTAFAVPMFEMTVFFAAHFMAITYLLRSGLYPGAKTKNPDPRTTDDKFLIEIESEDVDRLRDMFIETGAEEVTVKKVQ